MPHLDGYDVARRLRLMPELSNSLLIASTGCARAEDRQAAYASVGVTRRGVT
jgi:CheY-like chemotaxis protein